MAMKITRRDFMNGVAVGGSVNLSSPGDHSEVAKGLLDDLGIDLDAMKANIDELADTGSVLALPGPDGHVSVVGKWTEFMLGRLPVAVFSGRQCVRGQVAGTQTDPGGGPWCQGIQRYRCKPLRLWRT